MSIVHLRFRGSAPVLVTPLGRTVEPEELVKFPGSVVEPKGQPADAIYVESGNPPSVRAWPTSLWVNETPATSAAKEKVK